MTFRASRILVTGGAGFVGSTLVRRLLDGAGPERLERLVVLDRLTYAGHRVNLVGPDADPRYVFALGDVCDAPFVGALFAEHAFDAVLHLAAESHVDRSIEAADAFVRTNVTGTFTLLEAARRAWDGAPGMGERRFVHVSTDEVFGALGETGRFDEASAYAPNSPYAASKASADLLARAYFRTYGLPVIVTNTCNVFGARQLPEKLLPRTITNATKGAPLAVFGEGKQVREWLAVDDHAAGLCAALARGVPGESYLFGSGEERPNLALVERVADLVDARLGRTAGTSRARIRFVPDRKGHDFRYAIDSTKARRALGWTPTTALDDALARTVDWYLANAAWCAAVASDELRRFHDVSPSEGTDRDTIPPA